MKQKSKLLKKICAWMLAIATIATTLIPSSGEVFADDDTVKEPVLQSESETPYGKILLKVPKKGGFIQFSNNDGIVQQLYVEEGKTYIKNMSTNEATEVIIPEKQDFTYEFVAELGTITTFETTVSEGYEVSTYKITTDSGEEVKSETDKTALSSTYKEEIEVKEETQVLEVVFDEVEEEKSSHKESETSVSKELESNESTTAPNSSIVSENNTHSSIEETEKVSEVFDSVDEKDSEKKVADAIVEKYIKDNINKEYIKDASKLSVVNILGVKQTLFERDKMPSGSTIDSLYQLDNVGDIYQSMFVTYVPIYDLSDESDYFVAFANTMMSDSTSEVWDSIFALSDLGGNEIFDCVYDYSTGLAYIPKSELLNDKGEQILLKLQLQLLQATSQTVENAESTVQVIVDNNGDVSKSEESAKTYDLETTVNVEKGIKESELLVAANGIPLGEEDYSYDKKTGELEVKKSAGEIQTLSVDVKEQSLVSKVKEFFEPMTAEAMSIQELTEGGWATIPEDAIVGDVYSAEGCAILYTQDAWTESSGVYGYLDEDLLMDVIGYNAALDMSKVKELNSSMYFSWQKQSGLQFKNGGKNMEVSTSGNSPLMCSHANNPIFGDGNISYPDGKVFTTRISLRLLRINREGENPYVLVGVLTRRINTQSMTGIIRLRLPEKPKTGKLAIQKTSANSNWTSGNGYYSLAGAHYGIWKNAACTEGTGTSITTDATGKGISGDLNAGDYYVKEITAPKGYKLDTNVYKVSVTAGDNNPSPSTLNDSNRHKEFPKPGNVYLEKVSSKPDATKDNPNYSLAGAEYSVYRDEACTDFVTKMVTDANGKAKTGDLALGKYWIKEVKPSPGHTLDIDPNTKKARVYSCELSDAPGKSTSYTVKSTDPVKLDPVPLLLRKVDAESGGAAVGSGSLVGAEFEVKFYWKQMDKDPATEGYTLLRQWRLKTITRQGYDGAVLVLSNEGKVSGDEFWYDDRGLVSFPYGTITFKEVKSPNGYLLDTKTHVVQVTGDPVDINGGISFHTPVQKEVSLKLNLTKKQFGTDKVIPGAKFLHTKPDGSTEELTTDANGALSFKGLQWGNHKVVETYVPDGYSINTNPITFKVETNNQVTNISTAKESDTNGNITIKVENDGNVSATVFDKPAPFDLAIHKVNNHDFALAGAEFTLYSDASCKTVVDKQISDTNGNLTMKKLIPEKVYYLKETKAPKGYRIPVNADGSDIVWKISVKSVPVDNKFEFYVNDKAYTTGTGQFHISGTEADRITNMTIVNEVGMKLPETGSSMMIIIIIAGIGLMAGALVISRRGKVKKTEGSEEK